MEPKKRISMGFEESVFAKPLRVNRMCFNTNGSGPCLVVPMKSVTSVFAENGTAPKYVVITPMTRIDEAETFRSTIEIVAKAMGIQHLEFKDPHECLAQFVKSSVIVVQVGVTQEKQIIIAGKFISYDRKIEDNAFTFRSRPLVCDDAEDTGVSEAFEFIRRVEDPNVKVILAAAANGASRSVVNKLHQLLESVIENLEIRSIFHLEEVLLKGALRTKPNRSSRTADQYLRAAAAALQHNNFPEAYAALTKAKLEFPCEIVFARETDFKNRLRQAATKESGTTLKRFEASIETDPDRLVQLWQEIAANSLPNSRAQKDALSIANLLKGKE